MHYYLDVLKKYAVFEGRARRAEYWTYALCNLLIVVVLMVLSLAARSSVFMVLCILYGLGTLLPSLGVLCRRLHDTGRPGGWIFISLVPFVGALVLLVFTCLEGDRGDNRFGPNPKGGAQPAAGPNPYMV